MYLLCVDRSNRNVASRRESQRSLDTYKGFLVVALLFSFYLSLSMEEVTF